MLVSYDAADLARWMLLAYLPARVSVICKNAQ